MLQYLAIDPGDTTGWASFDENAEMIANGQLAGRQELYAFIRNLDNKPAVLIVEEYRVYGHKAKAHAGSKVETVRVIGYLEAWADEHSINIVKQNANILGIAEKWSGIKPPSDHSKSHKWDAFNHGFYYLVKNNLRGINR